MTVHSSILLSIHLWADYRIDYKFDLGDRFAGSICRSDTESIIGSDRNRFRTTGVILILDDFLQDRFAGSIDGSDTGAIDGSDRNRSRTRERLVRNRLINPVLISSGSEIRNRIDSLPY